MKTDHVDMKGFVGILIITLLWGSNYPAIKITNAGFSPIFTSFLRSVIASVLGIGYCLAIRQNLFHRGSLLFHGLAVGILFGLEFAFLYLGMFFTDSARAVIFIYISPFVVAAGAHLFLGERLSPLKWTGLFLAFGGLVSVFYGKPSHYNRLMFVGDICEIVAAIIWGVTTLYIKKYLAGKMHPINTFLYQLVFSVPVLFLCSYFVETQWIKAPGAIQIASLGFQSVIIAFISYLAWFKLIHDYPVARLTVFTFLTPVFGVLFAALIQHEQITAGLMAGLLMVCAGIYVTNYTR
ncbi:MAG: DMT family transporter [Syntrophorhabdaceae bacterium]|nr:DMT family transporter [Syntrophorhabdaceae bacterium]MDD4197710.1 DMT family transporter [Syntrophorhabdaceae bacterium]